MKNKIQKIILSSMIVAGSLVANDTESLIGVELGFSSIKAAGEKESAAHGGIKIGAQSNNYRIFLSAKNILLKKIGNTDIDNAFSYGMEWQYLLNFGDSVNVFMGPNIGYLRINPKGNNAVSEMYYGGDTGLNIHAGDSFDIELGVKYMHSDIINNSVTAYAGLIYRFELQ